MNKTVNEILPIIIKKVHDKHPTGFPLFTGMGICATIVNYLIDKGKINENEREACYAFIAKHFYFKYTSGEPYHFVETWTWLMTGWDRTYQYPTDIYPYLQNIDF